ncbi:MAG: quinone-interacting membrane-bound oxidoreductase complex subunit QmoC [Candidatus Micrarchaeia archaeon]
MNSEYIEVNTKFIDEIIKHGGKDVKKCMQCAECSVICPLSPDNNPFPRKEMIWAQWGLKDTLLKDPDIWLCHNCADCSKNCPRNAKPGSVLNSLREIAIEENSWPRFVAKGLSEKKYLPLFILFPVLFIALLIYGLGLKMPADGAIYFSNFIPYIYIDVIGTTIGVIVVLIALFNLWRFWRSLTSKQKNKISFFTSLIFVLKDLIAHSWFKKCETNHIMYYAHLFTFYGFIFLIVATATDAFESHFLGIQHLLIGSPGNIIGNVSAVVILTGIIMIIYNHVSNKVPKENTYFDWLFTFLLFFTVLTGVTMEILRLDGSVFAYWTYLVHLTLIFMLIVYAPYSKFAHLIYRTIAMIYTRSIGRVPTI